jgi:hypothetical protein
VKRLIDDMTKHQVKVKGQPASRAYTTRRDWLAFLKEVTKFHFNPLMPNKSGLPMNYYTANKAILKQLQIGVDSLAMKIALASSIRKYLNGGNTWLRYIFPPMTTMLDIVLITNDREFVVMFCLIVNLL